MHAAFNVRMWVSGSLTLGIKTAQKPYIIWSLGPKALIYESLDSSGKASSRLASRIHAGFEELEGKVGCSAN